MNIPLAEKIAFLEDARNFPDRPERVETIETHFAWIFLSPRTVYKLKKPIRFGLIDFRETEARHAYCELEVTLNRRLAEATYERVVPLASTGGGLRLNGAGEAAEWLVQMRRLPDGATLADVGRSGRVRGEDLARIGRKLIAFYERTPQAPWDGPSYVEALTRFAGQPLEHLPALGNADHGVAAESLARIASGQMELIERYRESLARRATDARVIDAHGDLRAEHVFLCEPIQIIDCLEFSVELRWLDMAEEIAFLALDCDRLGLGDAGERLLAAYRRLAVDDVPGPLLELYRSRRALSRALLSASRVPDASSDADVWRARARWYAAAAEESIVAACAPGAERG